MKIGTDTKISFMNYALKPIHSLRSFSIYLRPTITVKKFGNLYWQKDTRRTDRWKCDLFVKDSVFWVSTELCVWLRFFCLRSVKVLVWIRVSWKEQSDLWRPPCVNSDLNQLENAQMPRVDDNWTIFNLIVVKLWIVINRCKFNQFMIDS